MKIIVISDTHGETERAAKIIKDLKDIDMIIHLGDYYRDAEKLAAMFPDIKSEYIHGNCDFMIDDVPGEKMLEYNGKRIFITHGHRYSVKWDKKRIHKIAEELKVDVLLFGHTHIAYVAEQNGCIILNPGSLTESRGSMFESYAILTINELNIEHELCFV